MIRYTISLEDLEKRIESESPGWLSRAAERTAKFRANSCYNEKSTIWGEVKVVYMHLQGESKCAYCERKLESTDYGKGEQHVDHFRPKSSVKAWKATPRLSSPGIPFATPPSRQGYYLLPYHPFNYAAACGPCNSALKRDWFPIAGKYNLSGDDPLPLLGEEPYLLYPIGDFDESPEDLIEFYGTTPRPAHGSGHRRNRALVTIDFFRLADAEKRKNLFRDRALILLALFPQLEKIDGTGSAAEKARAAAVVDGFIHERMPHANCARSFKRLYADKPLEAKAIYEAACEYIGSVS